MSYYPNLSPLTATRSTSLDGKSAGGGPTNKLDRLENWEGYRAFKDSRSQTGWSDSSGHVIGGIDTHGYPLLYNKDTKKLDYNTHHHGGISLSTILAGVAPALAVSNAANGALSDAGVPVGQLQALAGNLPGVGQLAGIANSIGNGLGVLPGNGSNGMNLGDLFSTNGGGQLPDWLQQVQRGISIFKSASGTAAPVPTADSGGALASSVGSYGKWIVIGIAAVAIFALARGVRSR